MGGNPLELSRRRNDMNIRLAVAVGAMLVAGMASSQRYPDRPIRLMPGQPGGGAYVQVAVIRDLLAARLGQPVVMDARTASLMGGVLARSQPDGYTLMAAGPGVWFQPLLGKTDYDMFKDFSPI